MSSATSSSTRQANTCTPTTCVRDGQRGSVSHVVGTDGSYRDMSSHKQFAYYKGPSRWRQHHNQHGRMKLTFPDESSAQAHIDKSEELREVYQCAVCSSWHFATKQKSIRTWYTKAAVELMVLELGERVVANLKDENFTHRASHAITERWKVIQKRHWRSQ